ncbi:hypothetical protein MG293_000878 [Ovis ammon polii]|uniref:Uncharacterized protein n=1 Tax=Ovis ammon polii TaxID=230172 RepID=A0AAD4YHP3_OVIAM|nr:hypothetical protein MG293_000878 [Ovis ammon polii]
MEEPVLYSVQQCCIFISSPECLEARASVELNPARNQSLCHPYGSSEPAASPPYPIADNPSALPSPIAFPRPVSNTSCLFTRCQPLYTVLYSPSALYYRTFQGQHYNKTTIHLQEPQKSKHKLCPFLCDPMECNPTGSSIHGILQSGLPFPSPGDLPDPGIELMSSAVTAFMLFQSLVDHCSAAQRSVLSDSLRLHGL